MWNLKRKKRTNKIETDSWTYRTDRCWMGRRLDGWVKKVKGLIKYKLVNTKQSQGCIGEQREYSHLHFNNYVWCQVGT